MKKINITDEQKQLMEEYGLSPANTINVSAAEYDYGEMLMDSNAPLINILILSRGSVKVYADAPDGKSLILCYFVEKGILGDMELLGSHPHIANNVIAAAPAEAVVIPYQENRDLLENNLTFMKHLAEDLALKLLTSSRNYTAAVLDSAEQRLARYILSTSYKNHFSEVMKDVSLSTGISYRHMYRIIDHFMDEKILLKEKEGYFILNKEKLLAVEEGKIK